MTAPPATETRGRHAGKDYACIVPGGRVLPLPIVVLLLLVSAVVPAFAAGGSSSKCAPTGCCNTSEVDIYVTFGSGNEVCGVREAPIVVTDDSTYCDGKTNVLDTDGYRVCCTGNTINWDAGTQTGFCYSGNNYASHDDAFLLYAERPDVTLKSTGGYLSGVGVPTYIRAFTDDAMHISGSEIEVELVDDNSVRILFGPATTAVVVIDTGSTAIATSSGVSSATASSSLITSAAAWSLIPEEDGDLEFELCVDSTAICTPTFGVRVESCLETFDITLDSTPPFTTASVLTFSAEVVSKPSVALASLKAYKNDYTHLDLTSVDLELATGALSTSGDWSSGTCTNGVCTWTGLSITQPMAGIQVSATKATCTSCCFSASAATSAPFSIGPVADALVFGAGGAPTNIFVGQDFSPVVTFQVEDSGGSQITYGAHAEGTVTVSFGVDCTASMDTLPSSHSVAFTGGSGSMGAFSLDRPDVSGCTVELNVHGQTASATVNVYPRATTAELVLPGVADVKVLVPFSTPPECEVRDVDDNVIDDGSPHASAEVTLDIVSGPGAFSGSPTVAASSGTATFGSVTLDTRGFYTLRCFLAPGFGESGTGTSAGGTFNVEVFATLDAIVLSQQPEGDVLPDAQFSAYPVVVFHDGGSPFTSGPDSTLPIAVTLQTGSGTLTAPESPLAAIGGVVTWGSLAIDTAGTTFVLRFDAGSGIRVDSDPFTIYQVAADLVAVTAPGGETVFAGSTFATFDVEIHDAGGSLVTDGPHSMLTVNISHTSAATQSGSWSEAATGGQVSFAGLSIGAPGFTHGTVTFTADVTAPSLSVPMGMLLLQAPVDNLFISEPPVGDVYNAEVMTTQIEVLLRDVENNVIALGDHAILDVQIEVAAGSGEVSGVDVATASNGEATTFLVSIDGAGFAASDTFTLRAFVVSQPAIDVFSTAFAIWAHGDHLQWRQEPQTASGMVMDDVLLPMPEVGLYDSNSNLIVIGPDAVLDIALSMPPARGVLAGATTATMVAGVTDPFTGIAVTDLLYDTTPIELLAEVPALPGVTSVLSAPFLVYPKIDHLEVVQGQCDMFSDSPPSVDHRVELRDYLNVVIQDGPHAQLDITVAANSNGFVSSTTTETAAVGVAVFSDIQIGYPDFDPTTNFNLEFATGIGPPVSTIYDCGAVWAVPIELSFFTEPVGDVVSGDVISTHPVVKILDQESDPVTFGPGAVANISFALTSGTAVFNYTVGFGDSSGGTWNLGSGFIFNYAIVGGVEDPLTFVPGLFELTATSIPVLTPATSSPFTIAARAVEMLLVKDAEDGVFEDDIFAGPEIMLRDFDGNGVLFGPHGDGVAISVALSNGPAATLGGTTVSTTIDGNCTTLSALTLSGSGFDYSTTYRLLVTSTSPSLSVETGDLTYFARGTDLVWDPPLVGDVLMDEPVSPPVVRLEDARGNLVDEGPHSVLYVNLTHTAGAGTMSNGDALAAQLVGGISSPFPDITFGGPSFLPSATFEIEASIDSPSIVLTSAQFEIFAVADRLVFDTQPGGDVLASQDLSTMPVVHILDFNSSLVVNGPHALLDVTLTLSGGTLPVSLVGSAVDSAVTGGIANGFTDLRVDNTGSTRGTDFVLTATTAVPLLSVASEPFAIDAWANNIIFATQPIGDVLPTVEISQRPVVIIRDATDAQILIGDHAELDITLLAQGGTGALDSPVAVTASAGTTGELVGVVLTEQSPAYQLRATSNGPGLTVVSDPFRIYKVATEIVLVGVVACNRLPGEGFASPPVIQIKDRGDTLITEGPHSKLTITLTSVGGTGDEFLFEGTRVNATAGATIGPSSSLLPSYNTTLIGERYVDDVRVMASTVTPVIGDTLNVASGLLVVYARAAAFNFETQPFGDVLAGELLAVMPAVEILDSLGNRIVTGTHAEVFLPLRASIGVLDNSGQSLSQASASGYEAGWLSLNVQYPTYSDNVTIIVEELGLTGFSDPITIFAVAESVFFSTQPVGDVMTFETLPVLPEVMFADGLGNNVTLGPHAALSVGLTLLNNVIVGPFSALGVLIDNAVTMGVADDFSAIQIDAETSSNAYTFRADVAAPVLSVVSETFEIFARAAYVRFDVEPECEKFPGLVFERMPVTQIMDLGGNEVVAGAHASLVVELFLQHGPTSVASTLHGMGTSTSVLGVASTFAGLYVDTLSSASNYTLLAQVTTLPVTGESAPFRVHGIARSLVVTQDPIGNVAAGTSLFQMPRVASIDEAGFLVRTGLHAELNVSIALNGLDINGFPAEIKAVPGGGLVTGSTMEFGVAANWQGMTISSAGLAYWFYFNVTGPFGLAPTDMSFVPALNATSVLFEVFPNLVGGSLAFAVQPWGYLAGYPFFQPPVVHILDASGNRVLDGPYSVLTIGFELSRSTMTAGVFAGSYYDDDVTEGIADGFDDLTITQPGSYRLKATTSLAINYTVAVEGNCTAPVLLADPNATCYDFIDTTPVKNVTFGLIDPPPALEVYSSLGGDSDDTHYFVVFDPPEFFFAEDVLELVIDREYSLHEFVVIEDNVMPDYNTFRVTVSNPDIFAIQPAINSTLPGSPFSPSVFYGNATLVLKTSFVTGLATVDVEIGFFREPENPSARMYTPSRRFQIRVSLDPPPVIELISPSKGGICGDDPVQIYGTNLGRSLENVTSVSVGGFECPHKSWFSPTHIECRTPTGVTTSPFYVETETGIARSAQQFTVTNQPTAGTIHPAVAWSTERPTVTISGAYLGETVNVLLGDVDCKPIGSSVNESHVVCVADEAPGPAVSQVGVKTEGSCDATTSSAVEFEFRGPRPERVVPDWSPTEGGQLVTIFGSTFGPDADALLDADLAGVNCTSTLTHIFSTQVTCVTGRSPVANATGPARVKTVRGNWGASDENIFSYRPVEPIVTSFSPTAGPRFGGFNVTIYGEYFGSSASDIKDVLLAGNAMSCVHSLDWIASDMIICVPRNVSNFVTGPVSVVKATGQVGVSEAFFTFTNTTSHPPPRVSIVQPNNGLILGGEEIHLIGTFLGVGEEDIVSLTVGDAPCVVSSWAAPSDVYCITSPHLDGVVNVRMETVTGGLGEPSAQFTYRYPIATVGNFAPRLGVRIGGDRVTIRGEFFGRSKDNVLGVTIGGFPCAAFGWLSEKEVTCTTPPERDVPVDRLLQFVVTTRSGVSAPTNAVFQYVDEDRICNPSCPFNADCINKECVCLPGWVNPPACETVPVEVNVLLNPVERSSLMDASSAERARMAPIDNSVRNGKVQIRILRPSFADVFISMVVSDPSAATLQPNVLTFKGDEVNVWKTFDVLGEQDDLRDGDQVWNLVSTVTSVDKWYVNLDPIVEEMVTLDAPPDSIVLSPDLVPLIGGNVTMKGQHFDWNCTIIVGDIVVPAKDVTITYQAGTGGLARMRQSDVANGTGDGGLIRPPDPTSVVVTSVRFAAPTQGVSDEAKFDVRIINDGGTETVLPNGLFYTDNCPEAGQFGRGSDCRDCPPGAVCPGGDRIWPKPGYWNSGETSGFVAKCDPPKERCQGGEDSKCGEQYAGYLCGQCSEGFTLSAGSSGACVPCPESDDLFLTLLVNAVVWMLVAMSGWFLEDRENFSHVIAFVLALQEIGGVGKLIGDKVPVWMAEAYQFLILFSGDISFLKPDCQGRVDFMLTFGISIAYSVGIGIPLVAGIPIVSKISQYYYRDAGAELVVRRKLHYKNRFIRSMTVHLTIIYLALTSTALNALACVPYEGVEGLRLLNDATIECFTTSHSLVYAASWLLLIVVTAGWPIGYVYFVYRNPEKLYDDRKFGERWDFLYDPFIVKYRYSFIAEFWISVSLAVSATLLSKDPTAQFVVSGFTFFALSFLIIALSPFRRRYENWTMFALMLSNLAALTFIFLTEIDALTPTMSRYLIWILMASVTSVVTVLFTVVVYHIFWVWKAKGLEQEINEVEAEKRTTMQSAFRDLVTELGPGLSLDVKNAEVDVLDDDALDQWREVISDRLAEEEARQRAEDEARREALRQEALAAGRKFEEDDEYSASASGILDTLLESNVDGRMRKSDVKTLLFSLGSLDHWDTPEDIEARERQAEKERLAAERKAEKAAKARAKEAERRRNVMLKQSGEPSETDSSSSSASSSTGASESSTADASVNVPVSAPVESMPFGEKVTQFSKMVFSLTSLTGFEEPQLPSIPNPSSDSDSEYTDYSEDLPPLPALENL